MSEEKSTELWIIESSKSVCRNC